MNYPVLKGRIGITLRDFGPHLLMFQICFLRRNRTKNTGDTETVPKAAAHVCMSADKSLITA